MHSTQGVLCDQEHNVTLIITQIENQT